MIMKNKITTKIIFKFFIINIILFNFAISQQLQTQKSGSRMKGFMDSGGQLSALQAAYDVLFYDINVRINPASQSISGFTFIRAAILDSLSIFLVDLNSNFTVDSIILKNKLSNDRVLFKHSSGQIRITLPREYYSGDSINMGIYYSGKPTISTNPPWDDGFVWKKTTDGQTWASVACESEGGDCWWPCKDHPSDEPDSVSIKLTVPNSLVCVSNGRLIDTTNNNDKTKTFHWYVSNPINNYCVTFYLGPYVKVPVDYTSITGEKMNAEYWFLPKSLNSLNTYLPKFLSEFRFLEEMCGPYPFKSDKYSLVEAPYWGMEHQSAVAYGNNFAFNSYGFDYISYHETAHEWWGNLVTAKDWSDVWIHEGFATYMESLYAERLKGSDGYKSYMQGQRTNMGNKTPVAPNTVLSSVLAFDNGDVYNKGSWILHTLRYYVGDSVFFKILRRFAYPDSNMEKVTNGKQCRLATTDDFLKLAEEISGKKLDWFFNVYLRQASLPKLTAYKSNNILNLKWVIQNNLPFNLPVEVQAGGSKVKVEMNNGSGSITVPSKGTVTIDPDKRILMEDVSLGIKESEDLKPKRFDINVYPNPFNPSTTIQINIPEKMKISANLCSITGARIKQVINDYYNAGRYEIKLDLSEFSSGIYFLNTEYAGKSITQKLVYIR
jgi:aminopeptidase N